MSEYEQVPRTTPHRLAERVSYDRELVHGILDEALVCSVGFDAGGPLVLPVLHARVADDLYVHVSSGSGLALRAPMPVCVTATIVDALVFAKSWFHHSLDFRCVVVRGTAEPVTDPQERIDALAAIVDHVSPGRSATSRAPNAKELAATAVLRVRLREASAKVRAKGVSDEDEDLALPYWSGVVPVRTTLGEPEPDAAAAPGSAPPTARA